VSTAENKRAMEMAFGALADGDGRPLVALMAEEFTWTIAGVASPWCRSWRGKEAVRTELLRPLMERFEGRYRSADHRFTAEEERVVVEFHGRATTKAGEPYNNHYCYVCRFDDAGAMVELIEYADTALMDRALGTP
jgi:ketosteroid isomerase-like protein